MTNSLSVFLAVVILALIGADTIWNDAAASLFLARRGLNLIEMLAFWR